MDQVILVDEQDNVVGTMDKLEAHVKGVLHRAFSVLIFNSRGEMLIQKRAKDKYHSGGLWTNACCSHPMPGETTEAATKRRLLQEMGIETNTTFAYKFIYRAPLDRNLIEHELDHVFVGTFDGQPEVNSAEVESWKYVSLDDLRKEVREHPEKFTHWFKLILEHAELDQVV